MCKSLKSKLSDRKPMSPVIASRPEASPALSRQPFSRGLDLEAHQAKARAVFD